jgi:hypothetical protein
MRPAYLAAVFWLIHANAFANGESSTHVGGTCFEQNRLNVEPLQDETIPAPVTETPTGDFEEVSLPDNLRTEGFVVKHKSSGRYLIIPNKLRLVGLSWNVRRESSGKRSILCGSRLIALFERISDSEAFLRVSSHLRTIDATAMVLTPWMEYVRSVLPLPFLARQEFVSVGPAFPIGWPLLVWNIDENNTRRLIAVLKDVQGGASTSYVKNLPSIDGNPGIVGQIQFKERNTGNLFSISIGITADQLLAQMK